LDDLAALHVLIAVDLGEHLLFSLLVLEALLVELVVLIFEVSPAVNLAAGLALGGLLVVLTEPVLAFVDLTPCLMQASAEFLIQQLLCKM